MGADVRWYGEAVEKLVLDASDEILTKLAFQAEGEYKPRAAVDTGFMRNSAYVISPLGTRRMQAEAEAKMVADRDMAPEPEVKEHDAALHVAAEYTIYLETKDQAIRNGVQAAIKTFKETVQDVGKEMLG